jgi:hypothetical protein
LEDAVLNTDISFICVPTPSNKSKISDQIDRSYLDAFLSFCKDLGYKPELLSAVKEVNERIKRKR